MPKKLSPEEIERYHRDGYLAPVEVMPGAEAGRLRRALEAAEARWPEALAGAGRNNAHLCFTFLDEIVHHAGILDAVEDLIGPDILVCNSVLFAKEPGDKGFVSWHQDATYMGLDPYAGVTAWLALSPSNRISGCMQMIPGSHKEAVRPHRDTFGEANILTRGQTIDQVEEAAAVDLVLEPGQISLHHPRVIHGSQPNRGRDRRIGFTIQSYLHPSSRQTKGPLHAQLARGRDTHGHFERAARPARDMAPEAIALRDDANQFWADILYDGAERRRDY